MPDISSHKIALHSVLINVSCFYYILVTLATLVGRHKIFQTNKPLKPSSLSVSENTKFPKWIAYVQFR